MNCPQCQTPNQSDSAFCANCGTPLAPAAAPASAGGYLPPPGQGTPVGYGPSGGSDTPGGYGPPSGYGQNAPAGQYPPAQPPASGYPQGGGQYQPQRSGGGVGPFQFDLKRLTRVDQIVGAASLITLISLFLPWFSATVSASAFGVSESATESGTDAHGWLWLVFVIDLLIIAYLVMRAGWEQSPLRLPIAHAPLLIVATGLQLLLVLIAFFDMPSNDGISGVSIGWSWGAFIALIAALAAAGPVIWPAAQSYMQSRQR
jgi:Double zinc ribbon